MKITINKDVSVNIEGMNIDEVLALAELINNADGKSHKKFADVANKLLNTPFDKFPLSSTMKENKKLISLAQQVKEMRRLQTMYFQTRAQKVLKASILQEGKVDDMVNDILNQL